VVDIFAAAGLKKPDISILSDDFLAEVSHLPQKTLAVELLRKLLNNEIRNRSRRIVVKSRLSSELLDGTIRIPELCNPDCRGDLPGPPRSIPR
jgi:type I restriction enzyme R subunit